MRAPLGEQVKSNLCVICQVSHVIFEDSVVIDFIEFGTSSTCMQCKTGIKGAKCVSYAMKV